MVTSRPPHTRLDVVYYKATLSAPEALLRHICALGVDGVVVDEPVPKEGHVLWKCGDVMYSIHLFFVWSRCGPWNYSIEDLMAMEAAADHGDTSFAQELAALKRAHTIILVVEDAVPRFGRTRHFVKMLRADLIAAGRDPDTIPVVFQINHSYQEGVPTMPLSDLLQVLTWSRCDHVGAVAREKRGAKEALDRAIGLYEEMRAEREAR
ncbi:hypothetical protein [Sorangium sp. So ce1024]|uniref:hypothetical protein n=1 Tax=Sorangium sp. So ce1024 TaxID=3133327 RepID=UPI003F06671C